MSEIDLEDLKAKAIAATPGPWYCDEPFVGSSNHRFNIVSGVCDNATSNCYFIAAANPATVLDLIARLQNAEAERDALRAELEALRVELEAAKNQQPCGYMCENAGVTAIYVPAQQPKLPDGRLYVVDVYNEDGQTVYGIGDLFITGKQINEILQGQGND